MDTQLTEYSTLQAARESRGSAPDVLTGIAVNGGARSAATWDAKHNSRMETVARQMASSAGPYALEGRVGDCCDDEEVHKSNSFLRVVLVLCKQMLALVFRIPA